MSTTTSDAHAKVDVFELENSTTPLYLRDASTYRAYDRELKRRIYQAQLRNEKMSQYDIKKWVCKEIDHNEWRNKKIGGESLYLAREESFADPSVIPPKPKPPKPSTVLRSADGLETLYEKKYIYKVRRKLKSPANAEAGLLFSQTTQQYNKPETTSKAVPYGSPKNSLEMSGLFPRKLESEEITSIPSSVKQWARMRLFRGTICDQQDKCRSCDIYGPHVCKGCIEKTNRKIATETQRHSYPGLEVSASRLVSPSLAALMVRNAKREKRERNLNRRNESKENSKSTALCKAIQPQVVLKLPSMFPALTADKSKGPGRSKSSLEGQKHGTFIKFESLSDKIREHQRTKQQRAPKYLEAKRSYSSLT